MFSTKDIIGIRQPGHDVAPVFALRWSPRAMNGDGIDEKTLMKLFEAARWAPSAFNSQGWRFLYARRDTVHWDTFFGLLTESNKQWCANAAVLIVLVSKGTFDHNGKLNRSHSLTAGCAWENLALQGTLSGIVVHAMLGFDHERAREALNVPDEYTVEIMGAVGMPAEADTLPANLREREIPSGRKPLDEIINEGPFS